MSRAGEGHSHDARRLLDGVPVQISRRFRPPRVSLPVGFSMPKSPAPADLEYKFTTEERVVAEATRREEALLIASRLEAQRAERVRHQAAQRLETERRERAAADAQQAAAAAAAAAASAAQDPGLAIQAAFSPMLAPPHFLGSMEDVRGSSVVGSQGSSSAATPVGSDSSDTEDAGVVTTAGGTGSDRPPPATTATSSSGSASGSGSGSTSPAEGNPTGSSSSGGSGSGGSGSPAEAVDSDDTDCINLMYGAEDETGGLTAHSSNSSIDLSVFDTIHTNSNPFETVSLQTLNDHEALRSLLGFSSSPDEGGPATDPPPPDAAGGAEAAEGGSGFEIAADFPIPGMQSSRSTAGLFRAPSFTREEAAHQTAAAAAAPPALGAVCSADDRLVDISVDGDDDHRHDDAAPAVPVDDGRPLVDFGSESGDAAAGDERACGAEGATTGDEGVDLGDDVGAVAGASASGISADPRPEAREAVAEPGREKFSSSSSRQPDDEGDMPDEVRMFVSMGFSRVFVDAAVAQYADNQDEVLSYLLQCNGLQERGFSPESVVAALSEHESPESALPFLETCTQLFEMGFKGAMVHDAVARAANDPQKAIELLSDQAVS